MEHGKKKPPSGFVRAMKSAWQKIKEGLAITWNRLVNLLCKRKRSSIHPDGLPEKLLIKKAPFNPNEPLHHKVARKAEYNQLRPPKAPENQKDPPYTIPSRTAEAPPQPSSALVEFAFEPPKDQHHDV
ncbi:hypothetical protein VP01_3488g3 [Puccinia sorghi]|uniref:Uncharacterized protein n=1 Tax=Puccinia sorghi TaxID=27349 RepID=A0A0L6UVW5_9BASI|nr:hypothetical protein VP01_3488g3 [Puccinia sorghi]